MTWHRQTRSHRRIAVAAGVVVIAMLAAACGSGTSPRTNGTTPATGSTTSAPLSKTLGHGVTKTAIKIGISNVNFDCIEAYTDSIRKGEQPIYQAYIDDINAKGGINGRKLVPVFKKYCPHRSRRRSSPRAHRSPTTPMCSPSWERITTRRATRRPASPDSTTAFSCRST